MGSKAKRLKKRADRRRHMKPADNADVHARYVADSLPQMARLVDSLAATGEPAAAVADATTEIVDRLVAGAQAFDPFRIIEVARYAYLPWARAGEVRVDPSSSPARIELLAAIALAVAEGSTDRQLTEVQELSKFVAESSLDLDRLIELAHIAALLEADFTDPMALIAMLVRTKEVHLRNATYPDMARSTLTDLFDGNAAVREAVEASLGFTATDALKALDGLHQLQQAAMNARMQQMADSISLAMRHGDVDPDIRESARIAFAVRFTETKSGLTVDFHRP